MRTVIRSFLLAATMGVALLALVTASAAAAEKPTNLVQPTITGHIKVGATLTCNPGEWSGSPAPTLTLAWQREVVLSASEVLWERIYEHFFEAGHEVERPAESETYTPTSRDTGNNLRCLVTAVNPSGKAVAAAEPVRIKAPPENIAKPTVQGHRVGQTSSCSYDNPVAFPVPTPTYQWLLDGTAISGAVNGTFSIPAADDGHQLSCRLTLTNSQGSDTATSEAVEVTAIPTPRTPPTIVGTPLVGSTLTCAKGEWFGHPEPITFTYGWQRDGGAIGGANKATYTLVAADANHQVRCAAVGKNSEGSTTAFAAPVTIEAPPVNTAKPTVSGVELVGQTMTCARGEWTGTPAPTFAYAWLRDGMAITGAEGSSYEVVAADSGHQLGCSVTATNPLGSTTALSTTVAIPAAPAAPVNVVAPSISGIPHTGAKLTCEPGAWTGSPTPTYQFTWLWNGQPGPSGKTIEPTKFDAGRELSCLVTATNIIGATTASSAAVIPAPPTCSGVSIVGQGSPLQAIAQTTLWAPPTGGYNAICGDKRVQYTATSSSAGLSAWGFNGGPLDSTYAFIGTDEAPTAAQIAKEPIPGLLTIPVAQTAIAIPVNPPTNCTITEITNKQLEAVMRGTIKIWNKLQTASGPGCTNAPITRVVRQDGSETTYQLKNYLLKISEASLTCLPASVKTPTWRGLEERGAGEEPNILWPENSAASGCTNQVTEIVRGEGGDGLIKKVNVTEGSIGYALLADVETNKNKGENPGGDTHWIKLQDNGVSNKLSVAKFASPLEAAANAANCFEAQYPVPASAQVGAANPTNADWSQIFGANTNAGAISPGAYPLCTLSYIEALRQYSTAGTGEAVGDYVRNYLLGPEGQEVLETGGRWYAPLPEGQKTFDVLGAARSAAERIH